jgi:hypothetical protein
MGRKISENNFFEKGGALKTKSKNLENNYPARRLPVCRQCAGGVGGAGQK